VARVIERAGFRPSSHAHKNLLSVLHTYPRDELFQVDADTLLETGLGVLRLGIAGARACFVRRDLFGRFYSCLIYLPRENYNTDVRVKIQEILKRHLGGTSAEFTVQLSDAVLARIHMLVRTSPKDVPSYDVRAIEEEIALATRRWEDDFKAALVDSLGEEKAIGLYRAYGSAFPIAYRDQVAARTAVATCTSSRC
jgi:glutamate dehydrogenase